MLRSFLLPGALLAMIAMPQYAQFVDNRTPKLQCNDHSWGDRGKVPHCEMREQTLSASGATINVDALENGGAMIYGWDRPDVMIRAQVQTAAATADLARNLAGQVRVDSGGMMIRASGPSNTSEQNWSVTYEVFAPHRSNVVLQARNGGLSVSDMSGTIECHTVNGGLSLKRVGGTVQGETVNGGLHVELTGARFDGTGMDLKTTNGGVSLTVPQNYSARLESSTVNGGVHADLPLSETEMRSHQFAVTLGSGGPTIKLATTNGGLSVKRS